MERRDVLKRLAALSLLGPAHRGFAAAPADAKGVEELQRNWKVFLADGAEVTLTKEPLRRTDQEWRTLLTGPQFKVMRKEGTETSFTSPLNDEKRPGVYACVGCNLPLFTSAMKFDSGTGWPSFFTTIPGVFGTKRDFKILFPRTEYHCVRCESHHGHVFDDGPKPTGLRYCNNGVALRFIPKNGAA
jgi:peptide-methionine (R)-S-oxide reductase